MNVHDPYYRSELLYVPAPNAALFGVVETTCRVLGVKKPAKILTCIRVTKSNRQLMAIDLVDIKQSKPHELLTWRAYAEHQHGIISALHNLALYGCRGNELAFACSLSASDLLWYWVYVDVVTMQPNIVNGKWIRSEAYSWK